MHKIFAEFLSPEVSHLHHCDPTINSIRLDNSINEPSDFYEQILIPNTISQLKQISKGISIDITKDESYNLRILSIILGNEDFLNNLNQLFPINYKEFTNEELIKELQLYLHLSSKINESNYTNIIDHLSTKFYMLNQDQIKLLPKSILYLIIANPHFKHDQEDKLIEIIHDLFSEENDENEIDLIKLYEEVDFSKVSENKLREMIDHLDFTKLTKCLWDKLCECFFFNHHEKESEVTKQASEGEFEYKCEFDGDRIHRFEGIINYLTGKFGNVHENGIVNVTASTINTNVKYSVELKSDSIFQTKNLPNQWLMYDFKERKIHPTHYSIRTRNDNCDGGNPQCWCIEVSNTGNENDWRTIDSREGVSSLRKSNQSDTFKISTNLQPSESYRFIRLRQTGKSSSNNDYLTLCALEYFGALTK